MRSQKGQKLKDPAMDNEIGNIIKSIQGSIQVKFPNEFYIVEYGKEEIQYNKKLKIWELL